MTGPESDDPGGPRPSGESPTESSQPGAAPAPRLDPAQLRAIADEATVIRDAALLLARRMSELVPDEQAELARAVLDGYRRLTSHLGEGSS